MTSILELALGSPCHYCGADPGQHCRSQPSGRRATYMHQARISPIVDTYYEGYEEGEENILDAYLDHRGYFDACLRRHREKRARR